MANVLNRTTNQYLRSVNTPDYPVGEWIINPDLSAVEGWEPRYWIVTGDNVTLMDAAARSVVDAQLVTDARDDVITQLDRTEDILRAFAVVVLGEINTLRSQHGLPDRTLSQLRTAIRNKLGS